MQRSRDVEADADPIETAVNEVLRQAGGDAREAMRGLIPGQHAIEQELSRLISVGYARLALRGAHEPPKA